MSYSNYSQAAGAYRERDVLTASPGRLVVMVFDHILVNLRRATTATAATTANSVVVRREALSRARDGIVELLTTLDMDKGGELAVNLRALYGYLLTQLMEEAQRPDVSRLARVTSMITDLREAFSTVATSAPARVPAA